MNYMSNADWFARKLNVPQQPTPVMPQVPMAQPQPATYAQPQQPQYPPTQQMTPQADRCPGCGSGNYGGATPEARKRCYDCGYPIQQSGSGGGTGIIGQGGQSSGPAMPAKQVQSGGFNPTTIIGHI
jgi:hypothetical protein